MTPKEHIERLRELVGEDRPQIRSHLDALDEQV